MARREFGTGTIAFIADRWVARIYVGSRRLVRKRRTREEAETAIIEMIDANRDELGYFYAGTIDGRHHPERRRERPPRSGVTARGWRSRRG